jgi:hypothetical protein
MLQGNNRIETSQSAVSSGHKPVDERQHDRRVDISSAWTRPSRPSRLHDRHFVPPDRVSAQVDQAHGHTVHLMAPKFVAPYRMSGKLGKNDAADAMAICEVVQRPNMRFVPIKTEDQQSGLLVHRARQGSRLPATSSGTKRDRSQPSRSALDAPPQRRR